LWSKAGLEILSEGKNKTTTTKRTGGCDSSGSSSRVLASKKEALNSNPSNCQKTNQTKRIWGKILVDILVFICISEVHNEHTSEQFFVHLFLCSLENVFLHWF
jgi:hypothetical protein